MHYNGGKIPLYSYRGVRAINGLFNRGAWQVQSVQRRDNAVVRARGRLNGHINRGACQVKSTKRGYNAVGVGVRARFAYELWKNRDEA